jgi:hypothetical protein
MSNEPSPFEMLNLVKPGLGTALAKLRPPNPEPGRPLVPRWVIHTPNGLEVVMRPPGSQKLITSTPSTAPQEMGPAGQVN